MPSFALTAGLAGGFYMKNVLECLPGQTGFVVGGQVSFFKGG